MEFSNLDGRFNKIDFNSFCDEYQLNFPAEYISFLEKHNVAEPPDNIVKNAVNGKDDIYIRYFYGISNENYFDIRCNYEVYCKEYRMPYKCIPIADPDGGNQVCISLDPETYGKIYFWDHETMDVDEGEECGYSIVSMPQIANSFDELLEKIISI